MVLTHLKRLINNSQHHVRRPNQLKNPAFQIQQEIKRIKPVFNEETKNVQIPGERVVAAEAAGFPSTPWTENYTIYT